MKQCQQFSQFKQFEQSSSQKHLLSDYIALQTKKQTRLSKDKCKKQYEKWTSTEKFLYLRFLKINKRKLDLAKNTKKFKKFQSMAEYIYSKNANQCRSHHQKMLVKYKTNNNIINQLSSKPQIEKEQIQIQTKQQQSSSNDDVIEDVPQNSYLSKSGDQNIYNKTNQNKLFEQGQNQANQKKINEQKQIFCVLQL